MDALTRSAAVETLISDLERSHNAAHVSGQIAALRLRADRLDPLDLSDALVGRWEDVTDRHWNTLLHLARLCRWFRANPDTPKVIDHLIGGEMTLADARAEMPRQLEHLIRAREQLNFWTAEQAKHRPVVVEAPLTLPTAANSDTPSKTASTAA